MADRPPRYQRLFAELKRRRVFRVMALYGAASFAVLQAVDLLVPVLGLSDSVIQGVAIVLLLGAPVAILLEWVFELTPEGLRRTIDPTPGELTEIIEAPTSKRWASGLLALAGMTIFLAGAWYSGKQSGSTAGLDAAEGGSPSIAVLPFVNLGSDPEQEFFSDGISEELLNLLAKIPDLRVAARTSSFSFKDQNVEIPEIADRLKVAHLLQGSVRMAGSQVRVTAQLVRAEDGFQIWSQRWDRTFEDIFVIQDEIAADVAEQLAVSLLPGAPRGQDVDPDAYALYLQARYLGRLGTAGGHEQAIELLNAVLEIEPDYAPAWVSLSSNYNNQAGKGLRPAEEGYILARDAAEKALAIDSDYAPAYSQLGWYEINFNNDLVKATEYLGHALALDPSDLAIVSNAAVAAMYLGRFDQAIALLEYTSTRDPVNSTRHNNLGILYFLSGQLDKALDSFRTVQRLSPDHFALNYRMGLALLLKGEPESALALFSEEEDDEYRVKGSALALYSLGRQEEHEARLRELIEGWGEEWPSEVAPVYAWTGDADSAFHWLERSVAEESGGFDTQEPLLKALHNDPRWLPLLESLGKSPEQLNAIEFEISVPH